MSMTVIAWLSFFQFANIPGPASVSLSLAFGAGMLSTLSPCGFALLSAYLTYTVKQQMEVRSDYQPSGWQSLLAASALGLPLIAGVLLVLGASAGVLALGGSLLLHLFPWLSVAVGAGVVLLGGWTLLTGRALSLPGLGALEAKLSLSGQARRATQAAKRPRSSHVMGAAWVFGVGYGLLSP
jgi:cytochrome c biogenesis protein CcdA